MVQHLWLPAVCPGLISGKRLSRIAPCGAVWLNLLRRILYIKYAHARVFIANWIKAGFTTMRAKPIAGWYISEYRCANGICEKNKFYVPEDGKALSSYSSRDGKRRIRRAEKAAAEAKHVAARIVNNNFRAGRDCYLTDTFDDAGMETLITKAGTSDPDALLMAALHEAELQMRRVRYACKRLGLPLKYFIVKSDRNGKTLEPTRPHIHIIINREAAQLAADTWKLGKPVLGKLYSKHHGDLTDLVAYMIDQSRQVGTEKRYVPSRNLEAPIPTKPRPVKNVDAPLRVPKGCDFIFRSEQRAGLPQSLRYYRPPKKHLTPEGEEDEEDHVDA